MPMDYDAWLEKPYQDACKEQEAFDDAATDYNNSDLYDEEMKDFIEQFPDEDEDGWLSSDKYVSAVEAYMESQADYGGPYE